MRAALQISWHDTLAVALSSAARLGRPVLIDIFDPG
jgi:hypothetical protein